MQFDVKDLKNNYKDMFDTIQDRYKQSALSHIKSWICVVSPDEEEMTGGGICLSWELPTWYPDDIIMEAVEAKIWLEGVDYCEYDKNGNRLYIIRGAKK